MATLQGGLLGPDPGALSPAQLEQLRNFKIQTRIANEKYLRTHKEVELLLSGFFRAIDQMKTFFSAGLIVFLLAPLWKFMAKLSWNIVGLPICPITLESLEDPTVYSEMFLKRPDNILEFAADYFTDPGLPNKIHKQLIEDKKAA